MSRLVRGQCRMVVLALVAIALVGCHAGDGAKPPPDVDAMVLATLGPTAKELTVKEIMPDPEIRTGEYRVAAEKAVAGVQEFVSAHRMRIFRTGVNWPLATYVVVGTQYCQLGQHTLPTITVIDPDGDGRPDLLSSYEYGSGWIRTLSVLLLDHGARPTAHRFFGCPRLDDGKWIVVSPWTFDTAMQNRPTPPAAELHFEGDTISATWPEGTAKGDKWGVVHEISWWQLLQPGDELRWAPSPEPGTPSSTLYLFIEFRGSEDELMNLAVRYSMAALLELFRGRNTNATVVLGGRASRSARTARCTTFSYRELRAVTSATPAQAKELVQAHLWTDRRVPD